jgi:predicted TIM-barrel fold metal-dependent hydrolase
MWGTDAPNTLRDGYATCAEHLTTALPKISDEERLLIFDGNARRLYGFDD